MTQSNTKLQQAIELVLTGRTIEQVSYLAGIPEPDLDDAVNLYRARQGCIGNEDNA